MPDVPGNSGTTATIQVGVTVTNSLEVVGDHDWFRLSLTSGESVSVALNSFGPNGVDDVYLRIYDSTGNLLYENDDSDPGANLNSLLGFTASYTGIYFVDAGSYNDAGSGDYQLSISPYTPPPLWTNDQIANQLINGYWGGPSGAHRFNVSTGGTIDVNLIGLTADGQFLAREALGVWSDITGISFNEVTIGGAIVFDDDEEGAFADTVDRNGITTSANVNVSTEWLADYGTTLASYSFQTYVHEIGHALGLGHAGDYNGSGRYPFETLFRNDSWATTVMSYFDQRENTYFADLGFTTTLLVTPMAADVLAMSLMYGLSTTTRVGNTTYGFNSNAGRAIFDARQYANVAYTVFDSGGWDTLDYSGFSQNQRINLNSETFSNIGGRVGNVTIARGTIIENAVSGSGADTLVGNEANNSLQAGAGNDNVDGGAGNDTIQGDAGNDSLFGGAGNDSLYGNAGSDTLTGGSGDDIFIGTAAELSGDTIIDFSVGDRLLFNGVDASSFTFNLSGSTLNFSGGSLKLNGVSGSLVINNTGSNSLVQLSLASAAAAPRDVANDFNDDGRSDILFRNVSTGVVTNWLGQPNGSFVGNTISHIAGSDYTIVGTGDFNGDGRDDVLWRQSGSGIVTDWLGQSNGSFVGNTATHRAGVNWTVVGTGDFNGDGRDDVLWRNESGTTTNWQGQLNGSFVGVAATHAADTSWKVVGTGDFNGDGRDDILWQQAGSGLITNWFGQASGGFTGNSVSFRGGNGWTVAGTGDFNGDGRDDVLFRHEVGTVSNWLGQANGGFVHNTAANHNAGANWTIEGVGDYNGDGRDDVLWRSTEGYVTDWLGQANGAFVGNSAYHQITSPWQVQPDLLV